MQAVCSLGINLFRILAIYLTPILPALSKAVSTFLNVDPLRWSDLDQPLLGGRINAYQALLTRMEKKQVDRLVEASKESEEAPPAEAAENDTAGQSLISIDDFAKVQLKVARIAEAEAVPEADKLLRLQLDLGDGRRQVMAGIKSAYDPASLIDRLVGRGRQSGTAQDAVRRLGGHDSRRRPRRQGHLSAEPRHRRRARHGRQVSRDSHD